MAEEKVKIKRGLKSSLPSEKDPGTIYVTTDTGEMFIDDTSDSRVQILPTVITGDEIDSICGIISNGWGCGVVVDEANDKFLKYDAEGNTKANELTSLIAAAKAEIRKRFPD